MEKLDDVDPFVRAKNEPEKEVQRLNFLKDSFDFSEPETVFLQTEYGQPRDSYQYVPLKKSLKILLEDETFIRQKAKDPYFHEVGVYKDIGDGDLHRSNQFFIENPESVTILMFQDELGRVVF